MADQAPTNRTKLTRAPDRGHHDRETIDAVLDAGLLCHVAYVFDGAPVVTPTLYWREGDRVYWHGSSASRMLRQSAGTEVCLTVSHLDGIVCRIRRVKLSKPMKPGAGTDNLSGVLERQAAAVMGSPVGVYGVPHASVTQHYAAVGIPSVLYGAGPERSEAAQAGGPDECLALDDVRKATEVVALALGEFITPAG